MIEILKSVIRQNLIAIFIIVVVLLSFTAVCCTESIDQHVSDRDSTDTQGIDTSSTSRPLPKWLIDQKEGQTARMTTSTDFIKKDNSLTLSVLISGFVVLVIVCIVSILISKRKQDSV